MASIQKLNDCKDVLNELSGDLSSTMMARISSKSLSNVKSMLDTGRNRSKSKEGERTDCKPLKLCRKLLTNRPKSSHFDFGANFPRAL
jgi:hypothetical protein